MKNSSFSSDNYPSCGLSTFNHFLRLGLTAQMKRSRWQKILLVYFFQWVKWLFSHTRCQSPNARPMFMHIMGLNVENVSASVTVSTAIKAHCRHQRRQWGEVEAGRWRHGPTETTICLVQKLGQERAAIPNVHCSGSVRAWWTWVLLFLILYWTHKKKKKKERVWLFKFTNNCLLGL